MAFLNICLNFATILNIFIKELAIFLAQILAFLYNLCRLFNVVWFFALYFLLNILLVSACLLLNGARFYKFAFHLCIIPTYIHVNHWVFNYLFLLIFVLISNSDFFFNFFTKTIVNVIRPVKILLKTTFIFALSLLHLLLIQTRCIFIEAKRLTLIKLIFVVKINDFFQIIFSLIAFHSTIKHI